MIDIVSFVLVVIFEAENGDTMCEHKMSLTNHTKLVPTNPPMLLSNFSQKRNVY